MIGRLLFAPWSDHRGQRFLWQVPRFCFQIQKVISEDDFIVLKKNLPLARSMKITLVSNSMAPILPVGTLAEIGPVAFDDIQPLDFVVFFENGKLICHTVWQRGFFKAPNGERTLITRGLSNPFFDHPVRESYLLGRVTSHRVSRLYLYWLTLTMRWRRRI